MILKLKTGEFYDTDKPMCLQYLKKESITEILKWQNPYLKE